MDGVTQTLSVRFQEWERYDIERDCQVVQFQCVTDVGTWAADYPVISERELRVKRKAFETTVLGMMANGTQPHEVELSFG